MTTPDQSLLDPGSITFHPLRREDLPLMHRWLHEPHVRRWWHAAVPMTPEWVEAKYTPRIEGASTTHCFVIRVCVPVKV